MRVHAAIVHGAILIVGHVAARCGRGVTVGTALARARGAPRAMGTRKGWREGTHVAAARSWMTNFLISGSMCPANSWHWVAFLPSWLPTGQANPAGPRGRAEGLRRASKHAKEAADTGGARLQLGWRVGAAPPPPPPGPGGGGPPPPPPALLRTGSERNWIGKKRLCESRLLANENKTDSLKKKNPHTHTRALTRPPPCPRTRSGCT